MRPGPYIPKIIGIACLLGTMPKLPTGIEPTCSRHVIVEQTEREQLWAQVVCVSRLAPCLLFPSFVSRGSPYFFQRFPFASPDGGKNAGPGFLRSPELTKKFNRDVYVRLADLPDDAQIGQVRCFLRSPELLWEVSFQRRCWGGVYVRLGADLPDDAQIGQVQFTVVS